MGETQSFIYYDDQLFKEKKERAYQVPSSEEKGASNIIRCFEAKDGFVGYLKEEKSEIVMNTAWKLFKYVC